ncbi:unnamed protein product [Didymodactylos carnosus]|uniref:Uncharacterized protein n=1 Tax=Didymodactylos carnosus TaxID=1234261 RepID=A0A813VZI3_9BILA|nr:unnamed protein product [Didymodactylos carnosus]CAF3636330.1 unnamed protein product [Didymodactylos carnosus]
MKAPSLRSALYIVEDAENDNKSKLKLFFKALVKGVNSDSYMNTLKRFQISPSTLTEHDEILIFDCFNSMMHNKYYNQKSQNKFCDKWLPKYEYILHELVTTIPLQFHTVKYVIVNLMLMQRSMDNMLSVLIPNFSI